MGKIEQTGRNEHRRKKRIVKSRGEDGILGVQSLNIK